MRGGARARVSAEVETFKRTVQKWGGRRTVLWTYPGLRLGNLLYFALRAHHRQRMGYNYRVLARDEMRSWLPVFPDLGPRLLVNRDEVRRRDRREHIPPRFFQRFGADFTAAQLDAFVREVLLGSPQLQARLQEQQEDPRALTVNVRRGDYYDDPVFRDLYGFDVAGYVRLAVEAAERHSGRATQIHVVSDGISWCRQNLAWLADFAGSVTFAGAHEGPVENFLDLATSRRLVLANSTFSYWAAYVSNVVFTDNHADVWAPRFYWRGDDDGAAWQLDPRWSVIENLAGELSH